MSELPIVEQHLRNENLTAVLTPLGANIISLRGSKGHEYLWQGGAPWPRRGGFNLIFPVFGMVTRDGRYLHDGQIYTMPKHGFGRDQTFKTTLTTPHQVIFELRDNENTRKVYPFSFQLKVIFELTGNALKTNFELENTQSRGDLLFGLGSHTGFNWPWQPDEATPSILIFETSEPSDIRRPTHDFLDQKTTKNPMQDNNLTLSPSLFDHGGLFFIDDPRNEIGTKVATRLKSRSLQMKIPSGKSIDYAWGGFSNLGLWTRAVTDEFPKPGFLCLEPFIGNTGSALTQYRSELPPELSSIPQLVRLQPGAVFRAYSQFKAVAG